MRRLGSIIVLRTVYSYSAVLGSWYRAARVPRLARLRERLPTSTRTPYYSVLFRTTPYYSVPTL